MTNTSSAVPHVDINLDGYKHPHYDEWHYGERGVWACHPVVAQPICTDEATGQVFPAVVDVSRLHLDRDQLPEFIAWLTAVYYATSEEARS